MSMQSDRSSRDKPFQWRPLIAGIIVGGALLALATVVQHNRHGWPFTLHHNIYVPDGHPSNNANTKATNPDTTNATTEMRVAVTLDAQQTDTIGVRLERVQRQTISQPLRVVATVVPDESRLTHVHARVAGWLEQLHVNSTGQTVKAGDALAGVFSQDLFATQAEYLSALKASQAGPSSAMFEGAKTRLKILGMTEAEIADITRKGEPRRLVTIAAPRSGVILQRNVSAGTAVDPSTTLLTIADLTQVWVWAEVPETNARQIAVGAIAHLDFPSSGQTLLPAKVDFIYPTLTERSRTLRVRFSVPNPTGALRPGIFGTAHFESAPRDALMISRDAVVDTGLTQHVFVAQEGNHFEPRKVTLGVRLPDRIEIVDGLTEGEQIVASGVFLLDSESRLRASGGAGTGHSGHGGGANKENESHRQQEAEPPITPPATTTVPNHKDHGG